MSMQWHPLFASLLRPSLEGYYEMQTNVPVGDAPREADIVLLRRMPGSEPPFRSIWSHLKQWNVLELKSRAVSPRQGHIPDLVEVGLGVARRLNAERRKQSQAVVPAKEIAFWYLASRISQRFQLGVREKARHLEAVGPGLWLWTCFGHPVYLVSGADLPVDLETLPLHVVGASESEKEREVARFIGADAALVARYGAVDAVFHPNAWEGIEAMATTKRGKIDVQAVIRVLGDDRLIDELDLKRVIKRLGNEKVLGSFDIETIESYLAKAKSARQPRPK